MPEIRPTASAAISVIGARGFLGTHIGATLAARGHVVHEFDRDTPLRTSTGLDPRILGSDHVVWAASTINPMIAENDPDRVALDTEVFLAFVTAVAAHPGGPRTILLSSGGTVYDPTGEPPYSEASPASPRTAYGRAKRELERLLLATDPRGLVLRVSNAYGPGQRVAPGQGVVAHWLHAIAAGQQVHIFGDPATARDYVHVADIARAVALCVEGDYRTHEVLNIGAGRPTPLRDLFATIAEVVGDPTLEPTLHPARTFDARSTWLDCDLAARTLGWTAEVSLGTGIEGTWNCVVDETARTIIGADVDASRSSERSDDARPEAHA